MRKSQMNKVASEQIVHADIIFWNRLIQLDDSRMARKVFDWDYNHVAERHANWCSQTYSLFKILDIEDFYVNKGTCNLSAYKEILLLKQGKEWGKSSCLETQTEFYKLFRRH